MDLRTLRPLDLATVLESCRALTNRALSRSRRARGLGGWASGLLGMIAEDALHDLDDVWFVDNLGETPIPYSPTLEDAFLPQTQAIIGSVRARLGVAAR